MMNMKKILFTMLFAYITFATTAQFNGGIKIGLGLSNLTGDISENDMLFVKSVGFYSQFSLSDALTLQPELLLFSQGSLLEDGTNFRLDYIGLPVIFKYNLSEKFNIQAGPQIGFLLSTNPKDAKDGFTGTDFGLNFGAGGTWERFLIDLRYVLGLSNISDSSGELKTSLIQFSIGYQLFPRKSKN